MKKLFLFFSALLFIGAQSGYKTEGYYAFYDHERRPFFMSLFLPYNPTILSFSPDPEISKTCRNTWEYGTFYLSSPDLDRTLAYDLLWLDEETELETLHQNQDLLRKARLIYTSTHLQEENFQRLRNLLELSGFAFLTHWYWENGQGHALFLQKTFFDAYIRTLAYTPFISHPVPVPPPSNLAHFF